jgi:hypothetical protein
MELSAVWFEFTLMTLVEWVLFTIFVFWRFSVSFSNHFKTKIAGSPEFYPYQIFTLFQIVLIFDTVICFS